MSYQADATNRAASRVAKRGPTTPTFLPTAHGTPFSPGVYDGIE